MEKRFRIRNSDEAMAIFGKHDENLKLIEKEFQVHLVARGENLTINGQDDAVRKAGELFEEMIEMHGKKLPVRKEDVIYAIKAINEEKRPELHGLHTDKIDVSSRRHYIVPKTGGQKAYIDAIRKYDIVFGIGPAGTGKTYLAMAMAVSSLKNAEVSRIILTRPAVEAGESLGFLPGDIYAKVTPYLRPMYDALYEMMDVEQSQTYIERGIIEVAPLAYMRGRTLNDSFIILDEAQNCTPEQLKMFLTRLGFDSKTVITGDITQSDLPGARPSGLIQVQAILKDIEGIKFVYLTGEDVVRHELIQEIIKAYERFDKENK